MQKEVKEKIVSLGWKATEDTSGHCLAISPNGNRISFAADGRQNAGYVSNADIPHQNSPYRSEGNEIIEFINNK